MARLAIIGAGPKGAAIAAKAAALTAAGHPKPVPYIDLYDPDPVGAAWRGSIGYTDGVQPLCTRAERDLGFPYDTSTYGPDVAQAMVSDFSWQSYASNPTGTPRYHDWVVKGRHPPRHIDFAHYLKYAVTKAVRQGAARLIKQKVSAVDFDSTAGKWQMVSTDSSGLPTYNEYDGVVITGNGRPRALAKANGRVFNGRTFWQPASIPLMQQQLSAAKVDASVVIVGAGGTGAAIAYWFLRNGLTTVPITIVGLEATLFARHDGPFEDRLFTDEIAWGKLVPHVQKAFLDRTTAGVVWDYVLRNLVSDNIEYESYSARGFHAIGPGPGGPGAPDELELELDAPPDPAAATVVAGPPIAKRHGTVFIDARGFDRWGFADDFFAPKSLLHDFFAAPGRPPPAIEILRRQILSDIARDLSVCGTLANGAPFPAGLHVPGLGSFQGPAATNLMGLGWLADRVLKRYC
jgi:mycobactin lysine-N-oxygenase